MTFVQRGIGDVLLSWENEAYLAVEKLGRGRFDVVTPPASILAEPPVAVIDAVVDRRGTRAVATAYLDFLYSAPGQELAVTHYYRPRASDVAARLGRSFPSLTLVSIGDPLFGGWAAAQKKHFDEGGVFDQIYARR
jgi:sulfate transport system substrate-binding protein